MHLTINALWNTIKHFDVVLQAIANNFSAFQSQHSNYNIEEWMYIWIQNSEHVYIIFTFKQCENVNNTIGIITGTNIVYISLRNLTMATFSLIIKFYENLNLLHKCTIFTIRLKVIDLQYINKENVAIAHYKLLAILNKYIYI